MVRFWAVESGRWQKALKDLESGELDEFTHMASLVREWDFSNSETGEAIKVGELDELTFEQVEELTEEYIKFTKKIPKTPVKMWDG